jgi:hypothetical protein
MRVTMRVLDSQTISGVTVYKHEKGWFFYDETGDDHGPYETKELAVSRMFLYAHWLQTGEQYTIQPINALSMSEN